MEHTKGELEVRDFWLDVVGTSPPVSVGAVCKVFPMRDKQALANAERLVKCWNCHDELLEACHTTLGLLYTLDKNKGWVNETIEHFTKLIAKTEQS